MNFQLLKAQDTQFSMYDASSTVLNPALAGTDKESKLRAVSQYRTQYSSLGNNYITTSIAVDKPIIDDFFYTEKYPYISFKSESLSVNEKNFILVGALSIKEISKKEEIKFTYENKVFVGRMVIYSNDYGIKEQKTREKSKILVKITVPIF